MAREAQWDLVRAFRWLFWAVCVCACVYRPQLWNRSTLFYLSHFNFQIWRYAENYFLFFVDLLTININKTHTHTERYVNREHKRRTLNENIDELGIRNDLIRFSRFNFFCWMNLIKHFGQMSTDTAVVGVVEHGLVFMIFTREQINCLLLRHI